MNAAENGSNGNSDEENNVERWKNVKFHVNKIIEALREQKRLDPSAVRTDPII